MTLTAPAILGVDVEDFESDLSLALDTLDLLYEEPDPESGVYGGFYMGDDYQLTVKLTQYEAIPVSHTFHYRRAISGDDAIEVQYRAKLAKYTVETETAIYNLKEIQ